MSDAPSRCARCARSLDEVEEGAHEITIDAIGEQEAPPPFGEEITLGLCFVCSEGFDDYLIAHRKTEGFGEVDEQPGLASRLLQLDDPIDPAEYLEDDIPSNELILRACERLDGGTAGRSPGRSVSKVGLSRTASVSYATRKRSSYG